MASAVTAPGLRSSGPEPQASQPKALVPDAPPRLSFWVDQRRGQMRWEVNNGPVLIDYPKVLSSGEIDDLRELFGMFIDSLRRTAQAIETRSAKTEGLGPQDESAVATPCAQGSDHDPQ